MRNALIAALALAGAAALGTGSAEARDYRYLPGRRQLRQRSRDLLLQYLRPVPGERFGPQGLLSAQSGFRLRRTGPVRGPRLSCGEAAQGSPSSPASSLSAVSGRASPFEKAALRAAFLSVPPLKITVRTEPGQEGQHQTDPDK